MRQAEHALYIAGDQIHLQIDLMPGTQMPECGDLDGVRNQIDRYRTTGMAIGDVIDSQRDAVNHDRAFVRKVFRQ